MLLLSILLVGTPGKTTQGEELTSRLGPKYIHMGDELEKGSYVKAAMKSMIVPF